MTSSKESVPKLMTVSAASRKTGIPATAIRRAMEDEDLTYVQPNGPTGWKLIPPAELTKWVKKVTKPAKA